MAKKSAKSKGYRKQKVAKPYLTKKEIGILCVILLVLIAGAVLLFRYDDGALKVKDGVVVTEGDNWLIVNGSAVRGRSRYFKMGEMGEIEGYTRAPGFSGDVNVPLYLYTPEDADAPVDSIAVTASHSPARTLAEYITGLRAADNTEISALKDGEAAGYKYVTFTMIADNTPADAEGETAVEEAVEEAAADAASESASDESTEDTASESTQPAFTQTLGCYVDGILDSCIVIEITDNADTRDAPQGEDALNAVLEQVLSAMTLETKAK